MDTLNKEFWEKRDAAMKRFMASKERKRKRMAELEQMLRQDYLARTGEEPKFVNVWWYETAFFANNQCLFTVWCYIQDLEGVDNYAAMILRKDNPHFVDYVSEFNNTVNMFMLKPEH